MIEQIEKLRSEFERIKKLGYIKSTRSGYTGIGKTFEDLIGKPEDTLDFPDYNGIEIKSKRGYSKCHTTLFNATPKGKNEFEIKRLCNSYGYPDKILKNHKILNVSAVANEFSLVARKYYFKLKINYHEEKIFLLIYDKRMNLLENDVYWNFQDLKSRLERKLTYLAFIKAWPNTIKGIQYYKYYDIAFYKLKGFNYFLELIESGIINVTFKIGVFRNGNRIGEIHDRGTGFEIEEQNIEKLFYRLNI